MSSRIVNKYYRDYLKRVSKENIERYRDEKRIENKIKEENKKENKK